MLKEERVFEISGIGDPWDFDEPEGGWQPRARVAKC